MSAARATARPRRYRKTACGRARSASPLLDRLDDRAQLRLDDRRNDSDFERQQVGFAIAVCLDHDALPGFERGDADLLLVLRHLSLPVQPDRHDLAIPLLDVDLGALVPGQRPDNAKV